VVKNWQFYLHQAHEYHHQLFWQKDALTSLQFEKEKTLHFTLTHLKSSELFLHYFFLSYLGKHVYNSCGREKKKAACKFIFVDWNPVVCVHACMHHLWQASLVQFSAYRIYLLGALLLHPPPCHPKYLLNGLSGLVAFLCEGFSWQW
jgi:hypothetical protein